MVYFGCCFGLFDLARFGVGVGLMVELMGWVGFGYGYLCWICVDAMIWCCLDVCCGGVGFCLVGGFWVVVCILGCCFMRCFVGLGLQFVCGWLFLLDVFCVGCEFWLVVCFVFCI